VVIAGVTVIAAVLAPVFQLYDVPPEAASVALSPIRIIPSLSAAPDISVTDMEATGTAFTVTAELAMAEHPFALVTVTV
jgi:hypothetical protein